MHWTFSKHRPNLNPMLSKLTALFLVLVITVLNVFIDFHFEKNHQTHTTLTSFSEKKAILETHSASNNPTAEFPTEHSCHLGHIGHCHFLNPFIIVFSSALISYEFGFTPKMNHSFSYQSQLIRPPIA